MNYKLHLLLLCLTTSLAASELMAQNAPAVTTDMRYARGATMAFGRIKSATINGGSAISKRGFCLSETSEPTVDDIVSTKTLSNNGTIYYFENLKPATKYFMRAYATNKDGLTGYGEVIKFYTIPKGTIKLTMRDGGDQATYNRIKNAAETAVNWWNNLTEMKGFNPNVGYESGTPTADCSYGGWIRVGPNTSYQRCGTIMHEMLHGIGVIPWADTEWSRHNLRSSVNGDGYGTGNWLGDRVTEVLTFWDNKAQQLNGDYQHMWPYGINGAQEDNGSDLLYIGNSLVCQALGEDGLQHTYSLFAEPYYALDQEDDIKYYIKNESEDRGLYDSYLVPNANGQLKWRKMSTEEAAANDSAAWYITFTPENQYYQFRNASTGNYITYSATGNNGIKTAAKATLTNNEDFHLMKGRVDISFGGTAISDRGYWIIHPSGDWTPACLQANTNGNTAATTFDIANSATAQRWLIQTIEQAAATDDAAKNALATTVRNYIDQMAALTEVPHYELTANADKTFNAAITGAEEAIETATKTELLVLTENLKQAMIDFLSGVQATDPEKPFDLTYLIQNPVMKSTEGWSGDLPALSNSCGEFYETTFNFNQIIKGLPAGAYIFGVQAFQRPGDATTVYSDYTAGKNNVNAYVYAGSKSQKIANICDDAQEKKLGGSESAVGSLYVPNNMLAASKYFAKGLYKNALETSLATKGGSLKVGLRCSKMDTKYWVIFNNFTLSFYGDHIPDENEPTGISDTSRLNDKEQINGSTGSPQDKRGEMYDLQGRRVNSAEANSSLFSLHSSLKKGVYIKNGRKIVVK